MAVKKALLSKEKGQSPGPRGLRGRQGPRGPRGAAGPRARDGQIIVELGKVLARVTQELEDVQSTLKVQFTRIAELQAELDGLRAALGKANRDTAKRWGPY
jgi:hypothetical protein